MAKNITDTYEIAKRIFETLGFKEDTIISISQDKVNHFRKHLCEMITRKKSSRRYVTRRIEEGLKVTRIE